MERETYITARQRIPKMSIYELYSLVYGLNSYHQDRCGPLGLPMSPVLPVESWMRWSSDITFIKNGIPCLNLTEEEWFAVDLFEKSTRPNTGVLK